MTNDHCPTQLFTTGIDNDQHSFPRSVMSLIATYYIHLYCKQSPHDMAILMMNKLLNICHCPLQPSQTWSHAMINHQSTCFHDENRFYDLDTSSASIQPIIGKLFKNVSVHNEPMKAFSFLHFLLGCPAKQVLLNMIK